MGRETLLAMGLLGAAGLVSGAAWLASSPGSPARAGAVERFVPTAEEAKAAALPKSSQFLPGPPADPSNPPSAFRVTYGGQTKTLPLFSRQAGPPWNPDGYVVVYQTPLSETPRWRIHVMPQNPTTMHFGIYDGHWLAWVSAPFGDGSDVGLTITAQ